MSEADRDPLGQLAKAAGFDDGERWWEHVVEHNRAGDLGMFVAIKEAMAELRLARTSVRDEDEPLREAWMRRTIREAKKEGFERIAVVCGAWHAPALDMDGGPGGSPKNIEDEDRGRADQVAPEPASMDDPGNRLHALSPRRILHQRHSAEIAEIWRVWVRFRKKRMIKSLPACRKSKPPPPGCRGRLTD